MPVEGWNSLGQHHWERGGGTREEDSVKNQQDCRKKGKRRDDGNTVEGARGETEGGEEAGWKE